MIIKGVPFYSNTPDDTHCEQAAIRMILKYFLPNKSFTWTELEKLTGKKKGLWTWPMTTLININKMGFDIQHLSLLDYKKFALKGVDYLIDYAKDKKVVKIQVKNSDIEYERKNALMYSKLNIQKLILPNLSDIKRLLNNRYLIICNVNSQILNGQPGYMGHFIVIYGYDDKNLYIHDPGLPPLKNRKVRKDLFIKAWEYPTVKQKNIRAFKLN